MVRNDPLWANLRINWHKDNTPTFPADCKIYLPEAAQVRLFTSHEPIFIEDIAHDPSLTEAERETFAPHAASSAAVLPLNFIGQTLGVVLVYFERPFAFTEVTKRFWTAMTDQAGMALSNRLLIQEVAYRAIQMDTAAEVARASGSLLDLTELLNSAVALIHDRFELYYAGAFLVDDSGEWAVLRSGSGEAGRKQLELNHRLKVGGDSMIGWAIAHKQPRIALDVGKDAVRFANPLLPDTRSEMALPLIYHQKSHWRVDHSKR
jgi:GAF domain-containing protein